MRRRHAGARRGSPAQDAACASYNLRRLEDSLDIKLFERNGRRLILTAAGRRLRELGEQHAASFRQFRAQARGETAHPASLRVATVSGFGRYVLYPALRGATRTSGASIALLFRTAAKVFRMVEDGDVDCGVVYHAKMSSRLQLTPVYDEELVLIAPKTMRRPHASWRHLKGYSELPFVTYEESDYVFGHWFDVHFGRQPASGIVRWHVTELEEVIDAVAHGNGVSIVPFDAVAHTHMAVRVVRPGERRCVNRVFRVDRVGGAPVELLDDVFARLRAERSR